MDIANLFPIAQELVIKLPDGSPTDIRFKVVGQDSTKFRNVARQMAKSMIGREGEKPDIDALEQSNVELIASCIVGWSGLTKNGEEHPYSHAAAVELLGTAELTFIREQVEAYVSKRANFFRSGNEQAEGSDRSANAAQHS